MKIHFTKMSGAGNDFVVVDNRDGHIKVPGLFAVSVCHRRFGIGADGVLLVEQHGTAAFTMKYYNADGSNAGMCGNGGRCIAKFAYDNRIVSENSFSFEGFGHMYTADRITSDEYRLAMKVPHGYRPNQVLAIDGKHIISNYLNTGT
ncbi:MAG: diaminopimelate epimerase, partial [Bacteroidetes bacterium]|nr:diaminopimelate epimerase [Bacteroidota bacterium]